MTLLKKLDALAEPNFSGEPVFNARIFGFLISAFAGLSFLSAIPQVFGEDAVGQDPTTLVYLLIGTTLPQLFAFFGGLRLLLGDARGKRGVVYAIALGLVYVLNALLRVPVQPCGDGMEICAAIRFTGLAMFGIPALWGAALFLYAAVGSMGYGKNQRSSDKVTSAVVTIVACVGLVGYARAVLT